ncbi:glutaredoxin family protein [Alteromonadaceae bacterium BrNp21-10]|nr:glutaredoxin family protein [Alteromonadaceae bacterium BrNp21-10]
MQNKFLLFSTDGCHLCELAQSVLQNAGIVDYQIVDIATDDGLFSQYGTSIPVLKREDNNAELNWPFNIKEVMEFVN